MAFCCPVAIPSKRDFFVRTTQSALAFRWEIETSPSSISISQRVVRLPLVRSKRSVPDSFSSKGSWRRASRALKNSVVASVMVLLRVESIETRRSRRDITQTA